MASFCFVWCRLPALILLGLALGEKRETEGGRVMTNLTTVAEGGRAMTNLTTVVYSSCVCSVTLSFIVSVPQPQEEGKVEDWAQAVPDSLTPATPTCTRLDKH